MGCLPGGLAPGGPGGVWQSRASLPGRGAGGLTSQEKPLPWGSPCPQSLHESQLFWSVRRARAASICGVGDYLRACGVSLCVLAPLGMGAPGSPLEGTLEPGTPKSPARDWRGGAWRRLSAAGVNE